MSLRMMMRLSPANDAGGASASEAAAGQSTPQPAGNGQQPSTERPSQDPGWMAAATAEQREKYGEWLRQHGKLPDLIEAHAALRSKASGSIKRPTAESTADEVAAWRKEYGVPDSPDGYGEPEAMEGVAFNAEETKAFRALAHEHGLSTDAAKAFLAFDGKRELARQQARQEERDRAGEQAAQTFTKDWGADYERNRELARRGLVSLPPALQAAIEEHGAVNDPETVKWLLSKGQAMGEDTEIRGNPARTAQGRVLIGNYNKQNHEY